MYPSGDTSGYTTDTPRIHYNNRCIHLTVHIVVYLVSSNILVISIVIYLFSISIFFF